MFSCPEIAEKNRFVILGSLKRPNPNKNAPFSISVAIPAEKLRRKDLEVARALEEKQRLIAEILNVPLEEFEAAVAVGAVGAADLSSSSSATAVAGGAGGGGGSSSSSSTLHPGAAAALADKDAREVLLAALAQGSFHSCTFSDIGNYIDA